MRLNPGLARAVVALAFLYAGQASSLVRFRNYGQTITVNAAAIDSSAHWLASTGGLLRIDRVTGAQQFYSDPTQFPNIELTALCVDPDGSLWIGTRGGYLYKRSIDGRQEVHNSYAASSWDIRGIYPYREFLIISSSRGCSIYDKRRNLAVKNAVKFGSFLSSSVNTALVTRDTLLLLACNEGFASLNISGDSLSTANFYDQSIWTVRRTDRPVLSFVERIGSLQALDCPAVYFKDRLLRADSGRVYFGNDLIFTLPSRVLNLATNGEICWFGTEEHYAYHWSGSGPPVQIPIPGPTFRSVSRIQADQSGNLWLTSQGSTPSKWWQGITVKNGDAWHLGNEQIPGMGWLGEGRMLGLCEQRKRGNKIWVGTSGGNVKCFDGQTNTWTNYWVSGRDAFAGFRVLEPHELHGGFWGKCDAIAQDSSGYLWISSWQNYAGFLVCFDPESRDTEGKFRRFFPRTSRYSNDQINVISLHVSPDNLIFAGTETGELLIFGHNGNPLQDGISEPNYTTSYSTIYGMATTQDGTTWIATSKGLYSHRVTSVGHSIVPDENAPPAITSIEPYYDNMVWLGTSNRGVARYDTEKGSISWLNESSGLINNRVVDLSMDSRSGYLWIATESGLSRYSLGHTDQAMETSTSPLVYPNPFRRSNPGHRGIVFEKLGKGSTVSIHDRRGALIERLTPVFDSRYGAISIWKPGRHILPGAYFYAVRNVTGPAAKGTVMIAP